MLMIIVVLFMLLLCFELIMLILFDVGCVDDVLFDVVFDVDVSLFVNFFVCLFLCVDYFRCLCVFRDCV